MHNRHHSACVNQLLCHVPACLGSHTDMTQHFEALRTTVMMSPWTSSSTGRVALSAHSDHQDRTGSQHSFAFHHVVVVVGGGVNAIVLHRYPFCQQWWWCCHYEANLDNSSSNNGSVCLTAALLCSLSYLSYRRTKGTAVWWLCALSAECCTQG